MPNSEDSLANKLCTPGITLGYSSVEQRKIFLKHSTYVCCKMIKWCLLVRIPQQKKLCTSGITPDQYCRARKMWNWSFEKELTSQWKNQSMPESKDSPAEKKNWLLASILRKNFRTAPYLIMHVHLTGDTLNNKAPYMDV